MARGCTAIIFHRFYKREQLLLLYVCLPWQRSRSKRGLFKKGRNFIAQNSNFYTLRSEIGGKIENDRIAFLTEYHFPLDSFSWLKTVIMQEKVGNPSETDSIKSQISSNPSRGKKDSTKRHQKNITSDSQVNSNFPYRWSLANLTFNVYFYRFLYLYITNLVIFRKNNVDKTVNQEQTAPKDHSYKVYII